MPDLLTESTLRWYNLANDLKDHKTGLPELHRVEMWITSLASRRSAAGLKGRSSVTRPRATSGSSASSIALTLATVCTNAESQTSKGFAGRRGGLEEEEGDEECEHPSQVCQDRATLGKRARKMTGVREQSRVHYIFILTVLSFSQELKRPLAFPLLSRSPALNSNAVSAGQRTPIQTNQTPLVRRTKALSGNMVVLSIQTKTMTVNIVLYSWGRRTTFRYVGRAKLL
jgi:hypothetical protein